MILGKMRQKESMKNEIIRAMEENRVEVFYQPIYSTSERRIVSAEALVRIRNVDGSILPPGEFIPIAEETGLIAGLGERVFEKVCQFLKESPALQLGIHYIEVNLSVAQCEQRDLAERYIRIMEQNQIEPWWINLEITETASVQTKNMLLKNMDELINFGVSFSLDDFGNGQSNLDYIIDMPVSVMKLDMNMIRAYFEDLKARFVVQATIRMAHDMDLMVVAEGVETKEQLDTMAEQKIDYIQGYYFSKPLPADEFIAYLEKHQDGFVDK
jgi:EAL domain-containing protein (putative c-di-GMP-specific phosphodiesterase class I)